MYGKGLTLSETTNFADNNSEFDKNGGMTLKRIENTVGKGEIAHSEQLLLFLQCFQKICTEDMFKQGLVWERVKAI